MKNNMRMKTFLRRYAEIIVAYCVLAVVLVLFAFNQADFFTLYGPQSIFNQVITLCVASLGQTVDNATLGIDLSVGNLIIFSNCVAATNSTCPSPICWAAASCWAALPRWRLCC